jgi:hypothetical protein
VATSGSALTFDGTTLTGTSATSAANLVLNNTNGATQTYVNFTSGATVINAINRPNATNDFRFDANYGSIVWGIGSAGTATEQMRLTSTGLGIGTSSPSQKLEILTAVASSTPAAILRAPAGAGNTGGLAFYHNDTNASARNWYLVANSNVYGDFVIKVGTSQGANPTTGTDVATFSSSGNLGLGVTPSAWNASFKAMQVNGGFGLMASSTSAYLFGNGYYNTSGNNVYYSTAPAARLDLGDGFKFFTAPSGTAGNTISFTQAMTLDASGNLGVGTTSPQSGGVTVFAGTAGGATTPGVMTLGPNSTTVASGEVIGRVQFYSNDASGSSTGVVGKIDCIATSTFVGDCETALTFHTNDGAAGTVAERARITSGGNLLLGTTSVLNSSIATFYKTATASNQRVLTLVNNGTSGSTTAAGMVIYYPNASSGDGSTFIQCSDSNTDRFYVLGNGNVQNANNSYGAISDIKLKENITDATPKLADLMQVRIRNYNLKTEPENKQIGVIAQELEQVFPAMVDVMLDRDQDGNNLGTTTKSVKYSVFVPMLIKAMQEQQALITSLTARVAALEGTQP